jgi:uncharacterized protein YoxC
MEEKKITENQSPQQDPETLKEEIIKIGNELEKGKKILSSLENFAEKFKNLRDLLDDEEDGVETNLDWIKRNAKESEELKKTSERHLNDISERVNSLKDRIALMDKTHEEFLKIEGKISERTQTIEGLTSTSESLKNDIERTKQESQNRLSEIAALLEDVRKKVGDMDGAYSDFLKIKGSIEDENHGLKSMLHFVQDIQANSLRLRDEIANFCDQSKEYMSTIRSNFNTSNELKSKIEKNLEDSNGIKQQVQEVANLVIDTGFGNSFQNRAAALLSNYKLWRIIFLGSVVLLALFLWLLFGRFDSIPDAKVILFRITLTSPLLFLIYFSASQYGKERDLNEKYEFKAVTAAAVRNHTKFLKDEFITDDGESNAAEDFAISVFKTIYKEPYDQENLKKIQDQIRALEKDNKVQSKIELAELIETIKRLKSIIPDDEFKKIL